MESPSLASKPMKDVEQKLGKVPATRLAGQPLLNGRNVSRRRRTYGRLSFIGAWFSIRSVLQTNAGASVQNPKKIRDHVQEDQVAILLDLLKSPLLDPQTRTMLEQVLYARTGPRAKAS